MKRSVFILGCFSITLFSNVFGQIDINGGPTNIPVEGVVDGVAIKEIIPTKRMIPYEFVREADMMWSKRVHRFIDTREKLNLPLFFPTDQLREGEEPGSELWIKNAARYSLWTIIRENIIKGNLTIYYPYNPLDELTRDGDQLKYPLEVKRNASVPFLEDKPFKDALYEQRLFGQVDETVPLEAMVDQYGDPLLDTLEDGSVEIKYYPRPLKYYSSKDIVRYNVKEDWFFDKERSVMDQRIIAIAPVVLDPDTKTYRELFWLYFPECRFVFNNYYVYNTKNDSQWMSFDDFFWKRQFTSTIYKQSDVFDRKIEDYRYGIDALLESQKITEDIRTFENDLWNF